MIANISPNSGSTEDTLNTLRYADRCGTDHLTSSLPTPSSGFTFTILLHRVKEMKRATQEGTADAQVRAPLTQLDVGHPSVHAATVHGIRRHADHVTMLLFPQSECTPDVDADAEAVPIAGTWLDAS
jgi:hypothetical protein